MLRALVLAVSADASTGPVSAAADVDELSTLLGAVTLQTPVKLPASAPAPVESAFADVEGATELDSQTLSDPLLDVPCDENTEVVSDQVPVDSVISEIPQDVPDVSAEDSEIEFNIKPTHPATASVGSPSPEEPESLFAAQDILEESVEQVTGEPGIAISVQNQLETSGSLKVDDSVTELAEPPQPVSEPEASAQVEAAVQIVDEARTAVSTVAGSEELVDNQPVATEPGSEVSPDSSPLLPRGSYNIDFDSIDLENFNPFGNKSEVGPGGISTGVTAAAAKHPLQTTPAKVASPKKPSPKKSSPAKATPTSKKPAVTAESVVSAESDNPTAPAESVKSEQTEPVGPDQPQTEPFPPVEETNAEAAPDSPPLVPKGSYNIDFDAIDLDSFNPFGTKSRVDNDTDLPVKKPASPAQPSPEKPVAHKQPTPKKATPRKSTPKKTTPKKASPKKSPQKRDEELDDSFHDAVEEIEVRITPFSACVHLSCSHRCENVRTCMMHIRSESVVSRQPGGKGVLPHAPPRRKSW